MRTRAGEDQQETQARIPLHDERVRVVHVYLEDRTNLPGPTPQQ